MKSREECFDILLEEQEPINVEDLLVKFVREDKRRAQKYPHLTQKPYRKTPRKTGSKVPKKAPSQTHDNVQHIIESAIKKIKENKNHIIITTEDVKKYAIGPAAVTLLRQLAAAFGAQYPALSASYDHVGQQVKIR